jgi:hypothetical protein
MIINFKKFHDIFWFRAPVITAPFSEKGAFLPSSAKMSSREQQKCHIECFFAELGKRVPFSEKVKTPPIIVIMATSQHRQQINNNNNNNNNK